MRSSVSEDLVLAVAANKVDKEHAFELEVAMDFAKEIGAKFFTTSAATGQGVDALFGDLARRLCEVVAKHDAESQRLSSHSRNNGGGTIRLEDAVAKELGRGSKAATSGSGCC